MRKSGRTNEDNHKLGCPPWPGPGLPRSEERLGRKSGSGIRTRGRRGGGFQPRD